MKKILTIVILSLATLASARESGGQNGNGGGSICIADKCMTLAEAGFRVSPPNAGVEISSDVVTEINKIAKLLPSTYSYTFIGANPMLEASRVIGAPGDIIFVNSADPKMVKNFLNLYTGVLKENGSDSYNQNLQIVGFTVDGKTYIIIDKYEQLSSARSKALLLIHEYSLRVNRKTLSQALAIDGSIVDYLSAKESGNWSNFNAWSFLKNMDAPENYYLGDIVHRTGSLPASEFSTTQPGFVRGYLTDGITLVLDYTKLLDLRRYDNRISTYVSPENMDLHLETRGRFMTDYFNALPVPVEGRVVYTRASFAAYVSSYLQKNPNDQELIRLFQNCGETDYALDVYAQPQFDAEGIYELKAMSCSYHPSFGDRTMKVLLPYMKGLTLDIPGKLVCIYTDKNFSTQPDCHLER